MKQLLSKTSEIIWGPKPSTKEEQKYLIKTDFFILSIVCLIYYINYQDRVSFNFAYVSQLKQDLGMKGNEFNLINTCFYIGYTISMIPHNLILLKIRPRYWICFCCLCWSILTLGMYKVTNYKQICVIRCFLGIFESVTFAGVHLILGSYYDESRLLIRTAIFTSCGLVGSLFSGVFQAAIYTNLDGHLGLRGWQYLFIIDFAISIVIIFYAFIFFPDSPDMGKPFYFTIEEHEIALKKFNQNKPKQDKFNWNIFKRILGRWHFYLFSILWVLGGENESFATNSIFALWLAENNYTIVQRNHYPLGIYGIGILATILSAIIIQNIKQFKAHYITGLIIGILVIISSIIQVSNPYSDVSVFIAQYLSGTSFAGQTVFFAYANIICHNDLQERAIVLASMNMFSNAVNAWWSILFYGADTYPFKKGSWALLSTGIASCIVVVVIKILEVREKKIEQIKNNEDEDGEISEISNNVEVLDGVSNDDKRSIEKNSLNV
ncbi:uncharacterized protein KGF55_002885 [Candida pseudojiufengensis]|uniref:uncharacterized protein n=1 Tax=Candida pseudojiufengensis TaxID=497109 RepID=UPI002225394C|nr:uncharacterized protein KGF55_002885 [Candida pseudojiufengensis]KAI5963093.1 hypothetical protein KGF55_002885 [Candida pseudojiufengensis]